MLHPILFTFIIAIAVNLPYMADGFLFTKLLYKTGTYSSKLFHELHVDGSDEALFSSLPNRRIGTNDDANDPSLSPEELVPLIMNSLKNNDTPDKDAGIKLVWEFSTDITKHIFKYNITEFIESCHQTADEFPTSFYGVAMNGRSWEIESDINRVGGEDGWIATQVMKSYSSDGRMRRWQFELRKNKRPPCLNCWRIDNIASSDRNGDFEATDRGDGWSD